ncbi:radical SAM protein [candidate division KSB1 bacterium]|nr:radical SAM protein [candidate division KSB1 bacterium]
MRPLKNIGYLLDDSRAQNLSQKYQHLNHLDFPLSVTRAVLFVTNCCNFHCKYCNSISHPMMHWETGKILTLLDSLAASGTRHVQWTGGEASIREDIVRLVEHSAQLNINNSMSTNLSLHFQKYKSLVDAGIQRFYISLDSLDASEYDLITASHNILPVILHNIEKLVDYKYQKPFHMTLNITLDSERYSRLIQDDFSELKLFLSWLVDSNVDDFKFLPVYGLNSNPEYTNHHKFHEFIQISRQYVPAKYKMFHHRLNTILNGGHGLWDHKRKICYQSLDDRAFDSIGSYGCIIQLREGAKPIYLHDDPYEYKILSLNNFLKSDRHDDPVCRKHCFDLYKDLNDRVHYLLRQTATKNVLR